MYSPPFLSLSKTQFKKSSCIKKKKKKDHGGYSFQCYSCQRETSEAANIRTMAKKGEFIRATLFNSCILFQYIE